MLTNTRSSTTLLGLALAGLGVFAGSAAAQSGPAGARLAGAQAGGSPAPAATPSVSVQPLQRSSPAAAPGAGPSAQRPGTQAPEVGSRPTGLARARLLFANTDQDNDGRVSLREAMAQGLERPTFAGFDEDGDQLVTQDEYIVGMRDLFGQAGQPVDPDLAAEATRIQALRRARAAQEERTGGPASQRTGVERPTVERPNAEQPTVERPAVTRPTVERPGFVAPSVERPAVTRPAVERPVVAERPGVERQAPFQRPATGQVDPRRGQASPARGQVDPRRVRNQRPLPSLRGVGSRPVPVRPGVQRPSTPRPAPVRPGGQRPSSSGRPLR